MFWSLTVWINCSSDLKNVTNSRHSASNFKSFSRSLEQIFLTVRQNNFGNKIQLNTVVKIRLDYGVMINMILSTSFKVAMTILWFEGKLSASDISILVQFSFGTIAMVLPICYINFLSQDVTNSLQELAECISESQITDENWKVITIQRINSFEGFDGHGFFTLGRSHLTSVVSNFITFIIVWSNSNNLEATSQRP